MIRHFCDLGSHRPDKSNSRLRPQLCAFYTCSYYSDTRRGFLACGGDEQGRVSEPSLACGDGGGRACWQESPTEGNSAAAFPTVPELVRTCRGNAALGTANTYVPGGSLAGAPAQGSDHADRGGCRAQTPVGCLQLPSGSPRRPLPSGRDINRRGRHSAERTE